MAAPHKSEDPGETGPIATESTDRAIIGGDLSAGKPFKTLQAEFARRGLELNHVRQRGGGDYFEARHNFCAWRFISLNSVQAFLQRTGGAAREDGS